MPATASSARSTCQRGSGRSLSLILERQRRMLGESLALLRNAHSTEARSIPSMGAKLRVLNVPTQMEIDRMIRLALCITFATIAAQAANAALRAPAAEWAPSRPVRMIVPFPPGGAVDTIGR